MTNEMKKLSVYEEQIRLTGHLGLTGIDAVKAYRGAREDASVEEKVLNAIGVVRQGQPGALQIALRALEAVLSAARNS